MTVKELMERLATLDPDLPVVVDGYEGGFNDLTTTYVRNIRGPRVAGWWTGRYTEDDYADDSDGKLRTALVLPR